MKRCFYLICESLVYNLSLLLVKIFVRIEVQINTFPNSNVLTVEKYFMV